MYVNDHGPAHVHAYKDGAEVRVDLTTFAAAVRYGSMSRADQRRAVALVRQHATTLRAHWRTHHG